MTLARRELIMGAAILLLRAPARGETLVLTEKILTDPLSGIAIYGFDPVLYFLEGRAAPGKPEAETIWSGVAWRFASEANRAAFLRNPEVFAPAFGGYDAEAVVRGAAVVSDPTVFLVEDGRLFLFRSAEARDRFRSQALAPAADKAWPQVARELKP
jgi:hypothetical protein